MGASHNVKGDTFRNRKCLLFYAIFNPEKTGNVRILSCQSFASIIILSNVIRSQNYDFKAR